MLRPSVQFAFFASCREGEQRKCFAVVSASCVVKLRQVASRPDNRKRSVVTFYHCNTSAAIKRHPRRWTTNREEFYTTEVKS